MTYNPKYLTAGQIIRGDRITESGQAENLDRNLVVEVSTYPLMDGEEVVELIFADDSRIRTVPGERFQIAEEAPSVTEGGVRFPKPDSPLPWPQPGEVVQPF